jgi:hypothetical protein
MTPMDENLFVKIEDDIEASDGSAEDDKGLDDKDLLESLEKKAAEIESEAESSKQGEEGSRQ